ncbi:MAG TPA: hypothetical protein VKB57_14905 [Acidimicrobiales bacterium]|nr:hypothetical protein [Acidimicrobiales bacterium]
MSIGVSPRTDQGDADAFAAGDLVTLLRPYARVVRFPGGLRVVDVHTPHAVDEATRRAVGLALRPLLVEFYGPATGGSLQRFGDMFTILDRMLIVVGAEHHDLRCWITYTMLRVHRRPVMWIHAAVTRPGLRSTRVVPLVVGTWIIEEWLRHGCRPLHLAGMTRNRQLLRYFRAVWGDDKVFPREDGAQPPYVRCVAEIVGRRVVHGLQRSGAAPDAALDLDAQVVRDAFPHAPAGATVFLRPQDAYLLVVRASIRDVARQVPGVPTMLSARRRAEARLGVRHAARR